MAFKRNVKEDLVELLANATNATSEDITEDLTLEMMGLDSAATVRLVSHIEQEFAICLNAQDFVRDATVRELCKMIALKVG